MIQQDFFLNLNPSRIYGAAEVTEEVDGRIQKGIFIPYERAMKRIGNDYYLRFALCRGYKLTKKGGSHNIIHILSKDLYNELKKRNIIKKPINCGTGYRNFGVKYE